MPKQKQGAKVLRALSGVAKLATEDLDFEQIACEDGMKNVLNRLREFFLPHLEVSLPRAFESAVYGAPRSGKETFVEYVARMDKAFRALAREGVDLPESAQGYILYRQASLTEHQEQRVQTWAQGKYDRSSVITSLRRLDKVVREKGKASYAIEVAGSSAFMGEENEDSGDEFIYVAEGDLDEVLEESAVHEALASYREMRQAFKDQKTSRGYYPGKVKSVPSFPKGQGKQKVHVEQLKLRTRCNRCGAVGHWAKKCPHPKTVAASSSSPSAATGGQGTSKVGFFVASGIEETLDDSSFWLRQFVQDRETMNRVASPMQSEGAYKVRDSSRSGGFCGITTLSIEGVVDTAAEGDLIGDVAFKRLEDELRTHGLKPRWTGK